MADPTDALPPICGDCEDHGDGSYTCDPERPACRYRVRPHDDLNPAPDLTPVPVADLLQQLEELRAAGTPGPWTVAVTGGTDAFTGEGWREVVIDFNDPVENAGLMLGDHEAAEVDAALIMAAVSALPRLTAAVRAALTLADELASWPSARILSPHDAADRLRSALTAALTEATR